MTAPQPAPARRVYVTSGAWPPSRLLILVSAVCFLIAALVAADVVSVGPWAAWALGGVSAWVLAYAVP